MQLSSDANSGIILLGTGASFVIGQQVLSCSARDRIVCGSRDHGRFTVWLMEANVSIHKKEDKGTAL